MASQFCVALQSEERAKLIVSDIVATLREKYEKILQLDENSVTLTFNQRVCCVLTLCNIEEGFQLKLDILPNWGEDSYCIEETHLGSDINGAEGLMLVYRFFLAILYHKINQFGLFENWIANPDIIKLVLDMSKSIKLQFEEFDKEEAFNRDFEYRESIRDAFYVLYHNNSCYLPPSHPPQQLAYYLECHSSEMEEILDYIKKNQDNLEDVD